MRLVPAPTLSCCSSSDAMQGLPVQNLTINFPQHGMHHAKSLLRRVTSTFSDQSHRRHLPVALANACFHKGRLFLASSRSERSAEACGSGVTCQQHIITSARAGAQSIHAFPFSSRRRRNPNHSGSPCRVLLSLSSSLESAAGGACDAAKATISSFAG